MENEESRDPARFLNSPFLVLNSLALLAGHFLPWAAHRTAALTQSAHDLSISTNFTPGAGVFLNEWHLLPLWAAAILLALAAQRARPAARLLVGGAAIGIASLGLPAYPHVLTAFRTPDYRLQFAISLTVMAAIAVLLVMGARLSRLTPAIALGCATASIVPVLGYPAIRPAIEELYRDSVGLGAGWWLTLAAAIAVFVASSATILQLSSQKWLRS
jgi:hypothetical protein